MERYSLEEDEGAVLRWLGLGVTQVERWGSYKPQWS
jgi:hypothetical protein